jgi:hypothetical protein
LDFDFSRPEPEESEPTKDMDKDLRWDSQILTDYNPIRKAWKGGGKRLLGVWG